MIPAFNISGVLPPFDSAHGPTNPAKMSPYLATMSDFVRHFATSRERVAILTGLLDYRLELTNADIVDGFQWVDGSFIENTEILRGCPPADIDIVTFARRPPTHAALTAWLSFFKSNLHLFDKNQTKGRFKCDAYYMDLDLSPNVIVDCTRYWFGLFSHQRATYLWKGIVQIPLVSDDAAARLLL